MRGGSNSERSHSPGCFYPIFINPINKKISDIGDPLPLDGDIKSVPDRLGLVTVWPIARGTGDDKVWQMSAPNLRKLVEAGFAKVGAHDKKRDRWSLLYLGRNQRERIARGELIITGRDANGVAQVEETGERIPLAIPKSVWNRQAHHAGEYGSRLIRSIIPGRNFAFPKSIYAVRDCLKAIVINKPNALILDFFAGSGTTLHAVNLLNAADGGQRRCILVTNNEVSADEEKTLRAAGHKPGDAAWEALGIARHVTWPRTVCSIRGENIKGEPLKGQYLGSERDMAAGFAANAIYFKLGFLDKTSVALGRQFAALLPLLWMQAGARGECPQLDEGDALPSMLLLPQNGFAVLLQEKGLVALRAGMEQHADVSDVCIVADCPENFARLAVQFADKHCHYLYHDYLENFRINADKEGQA